MSFHQLFSYTHILYHRYPPLRECLLLSGYLTTSLTHSKDSPRSAKRKAQWVVMWNLYF